ncbi:hypothetical protein TNCV_4838461 [Trichonephila clavipes]|nr:hypothetical protein TNCV_4838461 [Trichonephila clavipes]
MRRTSEKEQQQTGLAEVIRVQIRIADRRMWTTDVMSRQRVVAGVACLEMNCRLRKMKEEVDSPPHPRQQKHFIRLSPVSCFENSALGT